MRRIVCRISDTFTKMYDRETYGERQTYGEKAILSLSCRQLDPP